MDAHHPSLKLDHIGVQVRDLAVAIQQFATLFGYRQITQPVINTRNQVEVVFLEKPGSISIKLFRSLEPGVQPTAKLHHLAFRSDDLDADVDGLVREGARLLREPAPGEAFEDAPIAFLFAAGLNVELISTDARRGRL
jgi:catechol 2,3-dioxygenase-like lactoylglutathione lyase family enzyme